MQKKLFILLVILGIVMAGAALVLQLGALFAGKDAPSPEIQLADAQVESVPTPVQSAPGETVQPATTAKAVQDASARRAGPADAAAVKREAPPPAVATTNVTRTAAKEPPRRIENDPKVPKFRQVLLAHRRIAVPEGRKFPTAFCTAQTMTACKTAPYLLVSEKRIDRDVHAQAMANGAKVSGFLPNNALLVEADADALKNLAGDSAFIAAVEYEPMDKLQPQLLDGMGDTVEASVSLMNARYLDAMRNFVTTNGGRVLKTAKNQKSFTAILTRKNITDLAGKGEVRWIEKRD